MVLKYKSRSGKKIIEGEDCVVEAGTSSPNKKYNRKASLWLLTIPRHHPPSLHANKQISQVSRMNECFKNDGMMMV